MLHMFMIMFVARESALIFIDEKSNSSMSEMLRRRNLHISDYVAAAKGGDEGAENQGGPVERMSNDFENKGGAEGEKFQIFRITYQKLGPEVKSYTTMVLFACVGLLALLNFPELLFISKFWAVIGSIVCPLIVIVIPGCFYYQVRKDLDEKEEKCPWRFWGIFYVVLGLVLLPIFLTLSTKNMFTGPNMQQYGDL